MNSTLRAATCLGWLLLGACGRVGYDILPAQSTTTTRPDAGPAADSGVATPDAAPEDAAPEDAAPEDTGVLIPDAGPVCPAAPLRDYCFEIPSLDNEPAIDGELDCGPQLVDMVPHGWTGDAAHPIPADFHTRIAAAWRPNGLYVFIEVQDGSNVSAPVVTPPMPWCGDGIEVYMDSDGVVAMPPQYDYPGAAQLIVGRPANATDIKHSGGERYHYGARMARIGEWTTPRFGVYPKPSGYVFEALIAASDLDLPSITLTAGHVIGFDIGIDVSVSTTATPTSDCGRRLGQYFMRVSQEPCTTESCRPYQDSGAFCKPTLLR